MAFRIIPFKKNNPDSLRRMYSIEFKNMVNIVIIPLLSRTLTALFEFERNAPNQIKRP